MHQEPSGVRQANFPDQRAIQFVFSRPETLQINAYITLNATRCDTRDYRSQEAPLNTTTSVVIAEGLA
jgi:hypothetical protein